jgi:hypothetical protein
MDVKLGAVDGCGLAEPVAGGRGPLVALGGLVPVPSALALGLPWAVAVPVGTPLVALGAGLTLALLAALALVLVVAALALGLPGGSPSLPVPQLAVSAPRPNTTYRARHKARLGRIFCKGLI